MSSARTVASAVAFLLVPAVALAQGVRWESTGNVEFGGALGLIARRAGSSDVRSTYALQSGRWLIDSESSGTIYNYGAGTFTIIDHEDRTYFTTSLSDVAQALEARAAEARDRIDEARAEAGSDAGTTEQAEVDLEVNVSVDRPGDRQTVEGYEAERFIITVEIGGEAASAGEGPMAGGSMVLLNDVWTRRDFPADRLRREMFEANPAWADPEELRQAGAGIQEAFAFDGRIEVAMNASAAELEQVGGHALLSRTSLVLVPPGATLDQVADFAAYDQPLGLDVKGAAAAAGNDAAADAVRGALGRLGFGKKQEDEEAKQPAPVQTVIMRLTDRVTAVEEGDLPPHTFQPPAGYQERTPDWLRSRPARCA